jgi:putative nucleotidyltransferase with HDIG domain
MGWVGWVILCALILLAVTLFLLKREVKPNAQRELSEAYRDITRGTFSTGPEAFNHCLEVFQNATLKGKSEAPSLKGMGEVPSFLDTVMALAFAIDAKDHYTMGHSQSVSRLAAGTARQMGLPDSQIEEVRIGGLLHDLGKISMPNSVLNKPSALTPEEYELMKSHTLLGDNILKPLRMPKAVESIRRMVRNHHERWDGTGYPAGFEGREYPAGSTNRGRG